MRGIDIVGGPGSLAGRAVPALDSSGHISLKRGAFPLTNARSGGRIVDGMFGGPVDALHHWVPRLPHLGLRGGTGVNLNLVGQKLLASIERTSGLPVERRSITAYDDVREQTTSYSHAFAEADPEDGGKGQLEHAIQLVEER